MKIENLILKINKVFERVIYKIKALSHHTLNGSGDVVKEYSLDQFFAKLGIP